MGGVWLYNFFHGSAREFVCCGPLSSPTPFRQTVMRECQGSYRSLWFLKEENHSDRSHKRSLREEKAHSHSRKPIPVKKRTLIMRFTRIFLNTGCLRKKIPHRQSFLVVT